MLIDLKESRSELKKIQSDLTFAKATVFEDLNSINKHTMEESERLGRYLNHLQYLDKGHTEFH